MVIFMSLSLRISLPKNPLMKDQPIRLVYRVIFGSGREMTLPDLARHLNVPYTTLFEIIRVGDRALGIGTHTDAFMEILKTMRLKRKRANTRTSHICPTCQGRGRMPTTKKESA